MCVYDSWREEWQNIHTRTRARGSARHERAHALTHTHATFADGVSRGRGLLAGGSGGENVSAWTVGVFYTQYTHQHYILYTLYGVVVVGPEYPHAHTYGTHTHRSTHTRR